MDFDVGASMRLAWCSDADLLWAWTWHRCQCILGLLISAAALQMSVAIFKQRARRSSIEGLQIRCVVALAAARNVALRASVFIILLVVLAWGTLCVQWLDHKQRPMCGRIAIMAGLETHCVDELEGGKAWYASLAEEYQAANATSGQQAPHGPATSFWLISIWPLWLSFNALIAGLGVLGSCLKWKVLVLRSNHIAALLSPMWAGFAVIMVTRWRIFGPLEQESFWEHWQTMKTVVLCVAVVLLPFYGKVRQIVHIYYRRSLRRAFYHDGEDVTLGEVQKEATLCPNVIVSATLVDYCRALDLDGTPHYSEFFFTPRWMGGDRTGFIKVPSDMSLSRVMAISGAATDAFLLTKMNAIWVRITLLALFNLFMGDYVEFKSNSRQAKWKGRLQAFSVNVVFVTFFVMLYDRR